ncbi:MAG: hypothetical protein LBI13_07220 [Streptococcaceae bacterium]|jgi:Rgg/GadR/MutR family transcriptional activator|nr:hypothetical protein [Streptococcaceae bacterium]
MNEAFGKTFQALRKAKGIESKAVQSDSLSYSQLMRFEQGKTSLTIEKLFSALNAINVNFAEFQAAYYKIAEPESLYLSEQVWQAYWEQNPVKIEKILAKNAPTNRGVTHHNDQKIVLAQLKAKALLSQLDTNFTLSKLENKQLYRSLIKLKQWTKNDCLLLMSTASVFTLEQLSELANSMIMTSTHIFSEEDLQSHIDSVLLTIIRLLIKRNFLLSIPEIFAYLDQHVLPDFNMYERAMLTYLRALYHYRKNPSAENRAAVDTLISAFTVFECSNLANRAKTELQAFK